MNCHLKNSELEPKFQNYKSRVVIRGDMVKDDSGSHAVFPEQGSSTSQMTAGKGMDVTSRLPKCGGQAADAMSGHTQVEMEDAPSLLKIPKSECPDIWTRPPKHKWLKSRIDNARKFRGVYFLSRDTTSNKHHPKPNQDSNSSRQFGSE